MGNSESNVASGVKKQADTSNVQMYKLVDLKGNINISTRRSSLISFYTVLLETKIITTVFIVEKDFHKKSVLLAGFSRFF